MSTQLKPPANKKMNAGAIAPKSISTSNVKLVTPRSRILKLPEIQRSGTVGDLDNNQKKIEYENPFHMPTDVEVFALRENDRNLKRQQKQAMNNMSIYEKHSSKKKNFKALLAEDQDDIEFYKGIRKRDVDKVLAARQTRADRHLGKENLQDFIDKKREMFLVHYALGVKRDEMRKLETIAQREEQKLLDDEKALEEDAAKFDAFLKENDKNSVEAIKKAEMETKAKLEKIQEIKKLNVAIMSIRSDMTKNEDQLKDLQRYRQFLDKLTPAEFLASKKKEVPKEEPGKMKKGGSQSKLLDDDKKNLVSDDDELLEADQALVYFKTPDQLLDIFAELEENNLAMIQNCQETEETLEELKAKIAETTAKMENETANLNQQIEFLNIAIAKEEEKAKMLEERAKMFSSGAMGGDSQEKMLDDLNHKVKEVYRRCLGDTDGDLSTLQMLTSIENRLEQLFEQIELMPPDKVEEAEKMKDKERRQRLREEKLEAQRALQEERVQRALERARAPVKKKTGKPVVFRSAPPQKKKLEEHDTKKKEE
ncbi:Coiled-coil domain-containing protein 38, partial [Boothiomyces sp. JEL0838]